MNRRGFLGAMFAAAAAPAFVRAESLMKIAVPKKEIEIACHSWTFELGTCGSHNWYMTEGGPRLDRAILPMAAWLNFATEPGSKILTPGPRSSFW